VLSISVMMERLSTSPSTAATRTGLGDKLIERLHADDRAGAEKLLRESSLIEGGRGAPRPP